MPPVKPKTKKVVSPKKAVKNEPVSLELAVFDQEGKEVEKISLPQEIFGLKINPDVIKQAVEAQMSQARIPYAHAKDRSEVRGGGKKPWRQKGTGRARHGSSRSPIWIGGGVTHGPRKEKNFAKKINRQMRRKALFMVLSGKMRDNEIIVLNDLKIDQPKTKVMSGLIGNIGTAIKKELLRGSLVVMPVKDENVIRAARNIPKILTIGANNLNVIDLLASKYLLMPKASIEVIKKAYTS